MLDTGCRATEFMAIDVGDVTLATSTVLVRHGKGNKSRMVFLGTKTQHELGRYLHIRPVEGTALWVTRRGRRLAYVALRKMLIQRATHAQVAIPTVHSFRRAFALLSLRRGMDVYSLQKLMGHSDLSVMRRYLAQTEQDLRSAHERSGPVDHLL